MKRKALVTGGAGFIGSHVAEQYLAAGWTVTVVDDLSSGRREHVPDGAEFLESDLGAPVVRERLATGGYALVNHHAAQMDVRVSVERPEHDARVNLLGLLNLLEGARAGGVRRVVFASSGGVVYGDSTDLPHPETARKLPVSPYGVSKLASEFYLAAYAQMYGIETVALRYANVYGPRQNPHGEAGVVAIFGNRLAAGRPLTVYGDGRQTRDYVYVEDVARANLAASTSSMPPVYTVDDRAVNIGTGVETSVLTLAQAMIDASGRPGTLEHAPARTGELARSAVRIDKAADWLGWRPAHDLAAGLAATWNWISSEG